MIPKCIFVCGTNFKIKTDFFWRAYRQYVVLKRSMVDNVCVKNKYENSKLVICLAYFELYQRNYNGLTKQVCQTI